MHIDPDTKEASIIENCSIDELFFTEGSSIKGKLLFKNCDFQSIHHVPYCFEQDLIFQDCTFKKELLLTRSHFKQALVFEFCSFKENTIFNDLNIVDDFHLNFSAFKKSLVISGNKCSGYIKCHINTVQSGIKFEDNVVSRDVNFRALQIEGNFNLDHNEIAGYLFIRQMNVKGKLEISMLKADSLTIDYVYIDDSFKMATSFLSNDLRILRLETKGKAEFIENILGGNINFVRSFIEDYFTVLSVKSRLNWFTNLHCKSASTFDTCSFSQQTFISQNIFEGINTWGTMNVHNFSFNHNSLHDGLKISKLEAKDIIMEENFVTQGIDIDNANIDDVNIESNWALNSTLKNIAINRSLKIVDNVFIDKIHLELCRIMQNLDIEYNIAEDFTLSRAESGDFFFYRNFVHQQTLVEESKTKNIEFAENQLCSRGSINNIKSNRVSLHNNSIEESLDFYNVDADDFYVLENNIAHTLTLSATKIEDLILKENEAYRIRITDGSFSGISISDSRFLGIIEISNVTASRDIGITKNVIYTLDLFNNLVNDVKIMNNEILKYINIDDTKANDIFLRGNEVARDYEATDEDKAEYTPPGITINACNVEGNLDIRDNHTIELLQINLTFADTLLCQRNTTKYLEIIRGKYRMAYVINCLEIMDFHCNYVSISKDMTFNTIEFHGKFKMQWCKIENDLGFSGAVFKDSCTIMKNTVLGSLEFASYNETVIRFRFSPIQVNRESRPHLLQNHNTFYFNEDVSVKTSFDKDIHIQNNKFNKVSIKGSEVRSLLYFDNNAVEGSLSIGDQFMSNDDHDITFSKALSITKNKINSASFDRLCFQSPVCLQHNNFNSDLTFHDTRHLKNLDFSGCFVGGSFEVHNSKPSNDDGDLILDNTFVDKRISFNNYSPASFSFTNATFNGFEVPQNWRMKRRKLIDKDRLKRFPWPFKNWQTFSSWFKILRHGDKGAYLFKENFYQKTNNKKSGLPYSFMKEYYEADVDLQSIPEDWKKLQQALFFDGKKLSKLDQTHRRDDEATDEQILRSCYYDFNQSIQESFSPVYFKYFDEDQMWRMMEASRHFSTVENNYMDKETKAIIEKLRPSLNCTIKFYYPLMITALPLLK